MLPHNIKRGLFTNAETRLLNVLADGQPHYTHELLKAIDELASKDSLTKHISNLRTKLMDNYEINVLHKADGKRVGYLLARAVKITMAE